MYGFKTELKESLLNGRTITWVANEIGITTSHLINVLNGKRDCSKLVAYCVVKVCDNDKEIFDYFIRKG